MEEKKFVPMHEAAFKLLESGEYVKFKMVIFIYDDMKVICPGENIIKMMAKILAAAERLGRRLGEDDYMRAISNLERQLDIYEAKKEKKAKLK